MPGGLVHFRRDSIEEIEVSETLRKLKKRSVRNASSLSQPGGPDQNLLLGPDQNLLLSTSTISVRSLPSNVNEGSPPSAASGAADLSEAGNVVQPDSVLKEKLRAIGAQKIAALENPKYFPGNNPLLCHGFSSKQKT